MRDILGRTTSTVCAGLLILSGFATTSFGRQEPSKQDPGKQDPPAASKTEPTVTLTGKVAAVNAATLTIVDDQKAETTIALDSTTKITKAGKEASLADVKADDAVTVIAQKGDGDTLTAIKITVA
jgi:hypothetical protein